MKKLILLTTLLIPFIMFSQTQLGADIDGEASNDYSGHSVSFSSDGTIVAIGASSPEPDQYYANDGNGSNSGHVRVYKNISGTWTQLGDDIDGEAAGDASGVSVSLSSDGTKVAIGATGNDGTASYAGHVRVYSWNGTAWIQLGADIDGEVMFDWSGYSVSLSNDGTIVAIGAPFNDANASNAGHVRVYEYSGGSWSQLGGDIDGEAIYDALGYSVSLSSDWGTSTGTRVAIGAKYRNANGDFSGYVRIYNYNGFAWSQLGGDIDGEAAYDYSGYSVSLSSDGTIVAIGAYANDGNGADSGHVRVYQYSSGSWTKLGDDIDGEASNDNSGYSVSLSSDGTIVAIGASGNNGNGSSSGHVRIYEYSGSTWTKIGGDIDGEAAYDSSGSSVSLSSDGSIVAIGAPRNDGTASNAGHVRVYDIQTPVISSVSLAADNSTITVTTSLSVYNSSGGSSDLEASDFALSISGGSATLTSATPTSISKTSQSVWVLGVGLTGTPTGDETLTVTPVANSIYSGTTAMSTTQTGNTASVNYIANPEISSVSLAADNSTITVTTSKSVYNSSGGSSDLEASDFALSISGGSADLTSATPTSISKTSQTIWVLGVGLTGTPTGAETLTVTPVANSIYYSTYPMSTTQTGNTASINNIAPTFDAVRLSVNNSSVAVTASETLYTTTGGSGALVAADFAFSISGGTATLSSTTPTSISTTGLVTTLGIGLSGTPDGDEILKLNPASSTSIYDSGNAALSATSIMTTSGPGVSLFPNTITATSLTSSAATTVGSLTVDNVVMDGATIGHSSDTDLMTLASGSLTVAGDVILSSDARLKSNIVTLGPTLISLMQLDAKRYTMKADKEQKQKIGLLAQEVQKVFPELVSEDKNGMLAVNYQALVPVLINALKEQEGKIKAQEKEMTEFEDIIPRLLKQIETLKKTTNN